MNQNFLARTKEYEAALSLTSIKENIPRGQRPVKESWDTKMLLISFFALLFGHKVWKGFEKNMKTRKRKRSHFISDLIYCHGAFESNVFFASLSNPLKICHPRHWRRRNNGSFCKWMKRPPKLSRFRFDFENFDLRTSWDRKNIA